MSTIVKFSISDTVDVRIEYDDDKIRTDIIKLINGEWFLFKGRTKDISKLKVKP